MARRRYLSTKISTDSEVNDMFDSEIGEFAAFFYTWMIPHVEDDATITGNPKELKLIVMPGNRNRTVADVEQALCEMERVGLIVWDRENELINFPTESFYTHQSYISSDKRRGYEGSTKNRRTATNTEDHRETPKISEDCRETAQIASSPSPSPSPSLSREGVLLTPPAIQKVLEGCGKVRDLKPEFIASLLKQFSEQEIIGELVSADTWALANPRKEKKDWQRFFNGWMSRYKEGRARDKPPDINQARGICTDPEQLRGGFVKI